MSYHRNLSFRDEAIKIADVPNKTPADYARIAFRVALGAGAAGCIGFAIFNAVVPGGMTPRVTSVPPPPERPAWANAVIGDTEEKLARQPWAPLRRGWSEASSTARQQPETSLRARFVDRREPEDEVWQDLFLSVLVNPIENSAPPGPATASAVVPAAEPERAASGFSAPRRKEAAPVGVTAGGFGEVNSAKTASRPMPDDMDFASAAVKLGESDFRFLGRAFAVVRAFKQRYPGAAEAGVLFNRLLQAQNKAAPAIHERSAIQKSTPLAPVRLSDDRRVKIERCLAGIERIDSVAAVTRPVAGIQDGFAFIVSVTVPTPAALEDGPGLLLTERDRLTPHIGKCFASFFDHGTVAFMLSAGSESETVRRIAATPGAILYRQGKTL